MKETERTALEAALGYQFRSPERLARALTHRSHRSAAEAGESPEDNERLEFLGDSVLGLVVSELLLERFPHWSEGQLSKSRARLVSARALAGAAQRLEFGRYLRLGRGEEKTGGREKTALLADAYEAVVAAVYLDAGLEAAASLVRRSLVEHALREHGEGLGQADYKSALQELLQARGMPPADYRVVRETGPDHRKRFFVELIVAGQRRAAAEGASKKEAEQEAARLALEELRGAGETE